MPLSETLEKAGKAASRIGLGNAAYGASYLASFLGTGYNVLPTTGFLALNVGQRSNASLGENPVVNTARGAGAAWLISLIEHLRISVH